MIIWFLLTSHSLYKVKVGNLPTVQGRNKRVINNTLTPPSPPSKKKQNKRKPTKTRMLLSMHILYDITPVCFTSTFDYRMCQLHLPIQYITENNHNNKKSYNAKFTRICS